MSELAPERPFFKLSFLPVDTRMHQLSPEKRRRSLFGYDAEPDCRDGGKNFCALRLTLMVFAPRLPDRPYIWGCTKCRVAVEAENGKRTWDSGPVKIAVSYKKGSRGSAVKLGGGSEKTGEVSVEGESTDGGESSFTGEESPISPIPFGLNGIEWEITGYTGVRKATGEYLRDKFELGIGWEWHEFPGKGTLWIEPMDQGLYSEDGERVPSLTQKVLLMIIGRAEVLDRIYYRQAFRTRFELDRS